MLNRHKCSNGLCYEQKAFDTFKDFWSLLSGTPTESTPWKTARHESAHAVIAMDRGIRVTEVTIIPKVEEDHTITRGCCRTEPSSNNNNKGHLDTALAGFVLDQACRVADAGANSDLINAYQRAMLITSLDPKTLMDHSSMLLEMDEFDFFHGSFIECLHNNPLADQAELLVRNQIVEVLMDMSGLVDRIIALSSALYTNKVLTQPDIDSIVNASSWADVDEQEVCNLTDGLNDFLLSLRGNSNLPKIT